MALLGGRPSRGCGCAVGAAPVVADGSVKVGPIVVTPTSGGTCPITRAGDFFGMGMFLADCAATVTNVGQKPVMLAAMEADVALPDTGAENWKAVPIEAWHMAADGQVGALWPGRSVVLPAPKSGYLGWMVVSVDPEAARRAGLLLGGIALVAGAGLAAGGYALGAHRGARRRI